MPLVLKSKESAHSKFASARAEMAAALIERDEEIDLVLTALVAKEHVLLVGPPGCAKSLLLDSLFTWVGGMRFSILLTRFSTPEEVLGPVSLAGLKEDRYLRITIGKLPEADFAYLDEVFKSSSAILNTLLRILNERTFDAGDGLPKKVPLKLCVGASNEWPSPETGKELAAIFDRFTFRKAVGPILTQAGRKRLLWDRDHTPEITDSITPIEIEAAHFEAMSLPWSGRATEAMETIIRELAKEGVQPGDRRQVKAVGAARAFAWLNGAERVEPEHLEVLATVLWDDPVEQPATCAKVIAKVANPTGMRVNQHLLEVEQILAGTDVRNLAEAAKAAAKLVEVERQLATLAASDRVEKARAYVKEQLKRLKLASLEAV
ncbi:MAG: AAA family ATPase [Gemmataceae bacterium]